MNIFHGFFAGLRNARFLMFPPKPAPPSLRNTSVMTGVFPDSELWNMIYGPADALGSELRWRKFKRCHEIAQERATVYRNLAISEAPLLKTPAGTVPISLRRPEIILAGVVGGSMRGAGISYMDIVAIYPTLGEVSVETVGDGKLDKEGNTVWKDFVIDLGDGATLRCGDIGMFKYKSEMISDAQKRCPDDLSSWVGDVTKIRKIEGIKQTPDGETLICVSTYRESKQMGDDHLLSGLLGRAFSHFEARAYEARIRNAGLWSTLSVAARFPHRIGPDSDWDKDFAHLSESDRNLVQSALLNNADHTEARAIAILEELEQQAFDIAS